MRRMYNWFYNLLPKIYYYIRKVQYRYNGSDLGFSGNYNKDQDDLGVWFNNLSLEEKRAVKKEVRGV